MNLCLHVDEYDVLSKYDTTIFYVTFSVEYVCSYWYETRCDGWVHVISNYALFE